MVRNPIILVIVTGLIFSLLELRLPTIAAKVVGLLASAAPAIALFTIGALLAGTRIGGLFSRITPILLGNSAIIMACMPMFAGYPVIGQRYDLGAIWAPALVITTLGSFLTINVFIWLISR